MSPSPPARALLGLIQIYKWTLSPFIGNACRYRPTCSSYAADSVRQHGAWAGSWMSAARLCRCAPWGGQGWDPAPESIKRNSWWRPWRYGDWKGPVSSPACGGGAERSEAEGGSLSASNASPLSHHAARADSSPAGGGAVGSVHESNKSIS